MEKVRELKMLLIGKQENHFREKQRRAEEKRNIKLKEKVRKAQEEEAKVYNIICNPFPNFCANLLYFVRVFLVFFCNYYLSLVGEW